MKNTPLVGKILTTEGVAPLKKEAKPSYLYILIMVSMVPWYCISFLLFVSYYKFFLTSSS